MICRKLIFKFLSFLLFLLKLINSLIFFLWVGENSMREFLLRHFWMINEVISSPFADTQTLITFYINDPSWAFIKRAFDVQEHFMNITEAVAQSCSVKKDVLRNFAKFTGKHLYQSLFFDKIAGRPLSKKRLWHRCFLVSFAKFLRTPFFTEHLRLLLLT